MDNLPDHCLKILRSDPERDNELLDYWSTQLEVSKSKFYLPPKPDKIKHVRFGVCHVYISNVIFRLVIDAIAEYVFDTLENLPKNFENYS